MSDIDAFAASLLEESKRFYERAIESNGGAGEQPNLHAALMLAFCSLEAHVNAVADEVAIRSGISVHDQALLLERGVELKKGTYALLPKGLKISRLEDRIFVLHRLGIKPNPSGGWATSLAGAIDLRNKLTHPKVVPAITAGSVKKALEAVIETIDAIYVAVYSRRFPAANRRLASRLDF